MPLALKKNGHEMRLPRCGDPITFLDYLREFEPRRGEQKEDYNLPHIQEITRDTIIHLFEGEARMGMHLAVEPSNFVLKKGEEWLTRPHEGHAKEVIKTLADPQTPDALSKVIASEDETRLAIVQVGKKVIAENLKSADPIRRVEAWQALLLFVEMTRRNIGTVSPDVESGAAEQAAYTQPLTETHALYGITHLEHFLMLMGEYLNSMHTGNKRTQLYEALQNFLEKLESGAQSNKTLRSVLTASACDPLLAHALKVGRLVAEAEVKSPLLISLPGLPQKLEYIGVTAQDLTMNVVCQVGALPLQDTTTMVNGEAKVQKGLESLYDFLEFTCANTNNGVLAGLNLGSRMARMFQPLVQYGLFDLIHRVMCAGEAAGKLLGYLVREDTGGSWERVAANQNTLEVAIQNQDAAHALMAAHSVFPRVPLVALPSILTLSSDQVKDFMIFVRHATDGRGGAEGQALLYMLENAERTDLLLQYLKTAHNFQERKTALQTVLGAVSEELGDKATKDSDRTLTARPNIATSDHADATVRDSIVVPSPADRGLHQTDAAAKRAARFAADQADAVAVFEQLGIARPPVRMTPRTAATV